MLTQLDCNCGWSSTPMPEDTLQEVLEAHLAAHDGILVSILGEANPSIMCSSSCSCGWSCGPMSRVNHIEAVDAHNGIHLLEEYANSEHSQLDNE